jgi:hypothetical protein
MTRSCYDAVPGQERADDSGRKAPSICRDLVQRETNTMGNLQGCGAVELYRNALACARNSRAATGWLQRQCRRPIIPATQAYLDRVLGPSHLLWRNTMSNALSNTKRYCQSKLFNMLKGGGCDPVDFEAMLSSTLQKTAFC